MANDNFYVLENLATTNIEVEAFLLRLRRPQIYCPFVRALSLDTEQLSKCPRKMKSRNHSMCLEYDCESMECAVCCVLFAWLFITRIKIVFISLHSNSYVEHRDLCRQAKEFARFTSLSRCFQLSVCLSASTIAILTRSSWSNGNGNSSSNKWEERAREKHANL